MFHKKNYNISMANGHKGFWFLETKNQFPQSHPISYGNSLQLKTVTAKDGGYYYCCMMENDSYHGTLLKVEVRVFGKLLIEYS